LLRYRCAILKKANAKANNFTACCGMRLATPLAYLMNELLARIISATSIGQPAGRPQGVRAGRMPVERLGVEGSGDMGVKHTIKVHRPGFLPGKGRNDKIAASTAVTAISQN
jgi:hypothetical protein